MYNPFTTRSKWNNACVALFKTYKTWFIFYMFFSNWLKILKDNNTPTVLTYVCIHSTTVLSTLLYLCAILTWFWLTNTIKYPYNCLQLHYKVLQWVITHFSFEHCFQMTNLSLNYMKNILLHSTWSVKPNFLLWFFFALKQSQIYSGFNSVLMKTNYVLHPPPKKRHQMLFVFGTPLCAEAFSLRVYGLWLCWIFIGGLFSENQSVPCQVFSN